VNDGGSLGGCFIWHICGGGHCEDRDVFWVENGHQGREICIKMLGKRIKMIENIIIYIFKNSNLMNYTINSAEKIIIAFTCEWRRVSKWETQRNINKYINDITICELEIGRIFGWVPRFWLVIFE